MIAQHCKDRRFEALHGLGEHGSFLRLAVEREIAGEQDQIGLAIRLREELGQPFVARPSRVNVTGCRHPDHP